MQAYEARNEQLETHLALVLAGAGDVRGRGVWVVR
jgi:hypothetical protein